MSLHSLRPTLLSAAAVLCLAFAACPVAASPVAAQPALEKAKPQVQPFALSDVRLLDGPFRDAMLLDKQYILSLDPDRLLHMFRINAGLPSTAQPYGGWEAPDCEVRGHSMGHYLSACALMYAATGDEALKTRANRIVAELAKCQEALAAKGANKGYLSAFPESFMDRVDARQPVWAPWYTLHKILTGLLDVHQILGNPQALDVLNQMAGWIKFRVDRLSPERMQASLDAEFGGMNEVLANLYAVTANPDHLRIARAFDHNRLFDPLSRGEDVLNGYHANTQIPKMIGAAREYELTGETRYRDIAAFFWKSVALKRSYVIGGHSDGEAFFPVEQFAAHLSPATAETCNTYNMLKLTRHLYSWTAAPSYFEFYERALYNHILASQDPRKGMFVYLMSLKPGHFKTYSRPEDAFWCCVGTGMENHAKYGDSIYWHDAESLYVNLFIASEVAWKERGLVLRQETSFPDSDTIRLIIQSVGSSPVVLKLRYPEWAASGVSVTVNGKKEDTGAASPGSYITLKRVWKAGDTITVKMPMTLRAEALPGVPDTIAYLYGPIVLAGKLGTEGMPDPYAGGQTDLNHIPSPSEPVLVGYPGDLIRKVAPVQGQSLTFRTAGLGRPAEVTLAPFFRVHHERYSVYWKHYTPEEWRRQQADMAAAELKRKAEEARVIDRVAPGESQSERDHEFAGENSASGDFNGRKWRHSDRGGWFSYRLKGAPAESLELRLTYWGGDDNRVFDILMDGRKIATETLSVKHPGVFFDQTYPVPDAITKGKERIRVKLQAQGGGTAGGIFSCAILRREKPAR
jgi:hypothetical protein